MNVWSTEDFQSSENTLYDTIIMNEYTSSYVCPNLHTTQGINCNVNYGLWVIMMCQGRGFIGNLFTFHSILL